MTLKSPTGRRKAKLSRKRNIRLGYTLTLNAVHTVCTHVYTQWAHTAHAVQLYLRDELLFSLYLPWSICLFLYLPTGKGGYWSGLMCPNCREAQGQQTVSVCSLLNWLLCRLAPVSPREWNVLKWRVVYLSCSALPLCDRWACASVHTRWAHLPNPLLSQENREQLSEQGKGGGGGRWMQSTGEGGGGSNGKRLAGRGVRHKVRSILFSYLLLWIEQWVRGDPKHFYINRRVRRSS